MDSISTRLYLCPNSSLRTRSVVSVTAVVCFLACGLLFHWRASARSLELFLFLFSVMVAVSSLTFPTQSPRRAGTLASICSRIPVFVIAVCCAFALPTIGLAQTWNGSRTIYWNNALNWSGGTLPANDGTADIVFAQVVDPNKATGLCSLDANWSVHSLWFNSVFRSSSNGSGSLDASPAGAVSLSLSGGLTNATGGTLNLYPNFVLGTVTTWTDTGGATAVNGTVSGPGGIVKTGSGTLTLTRASNNFAAGVSILSGTLAIVGDGTLGAEASAIALDGGTLRYGAGPNLGAQTVSTQRPITLGTGGGTLQFRAGTLTLNGPISGSGALTFGRDPAFSSGSTASRFVLANTNPYAGDTTIAAATIIAAGTGAMLGGSDVFLQTGGVLSLAAADNLQVGRHVVMVPLSALVLRDPAIAPAAVIDPARTTGGILALTGTDFSTPLDFATFGNGQLLLGAGDDVHYTAATLGACADGVYRLGGGVANPAGGVSQLTIAGHDNVLTGAASVQIGVAASGTNQNADLLLSVPVILGNANDYTGGTIVRNGTLLVGDDHALGSSPLTLTGWLGVSGSTPRTLANRLILNNTGGFARLGPGTLTFTGPVDLTGGARAIDGSYANSVTFAAPISNGALSLLGGRWTFAAANDFAGGLTLANAGTLRFRDDTNLGALGVALTLSGGLLQPADDAPAALTISRPVNVAAANSEVRVAAGTTLTFAGALKTTDPNMSSLAKSGAGTLALTGNTDGARLYVNAGVVRADSPVSPPAVNPMTVVVNAGGTLAGTDRLGFTAVNADGWLAPGGATTPGALRVSSTFRLVKGANILFRLGTASADSVQIESNTFFQIWIYGVTAPAVFVSLADAGGLVPGQTYTLMNWDSTVYLDSVTAASFRLISGPVGGTFAIVNNMLQLTTVALTPYEQWQNRFFANRTLPAAAPGSPSPAGDGVTNLVKYALGLDPLRSGVAGLPQPGVLPGFVTLTYPRAWAAADVTVTPEWSDDLATWSTAGITEETLVDDGVVRTVRARVDAGAGGRRFLRLRLAQF